MSAKPLTLCESNDLANIFMFLPQKILRDTFQQEIGLVGDRPPQIFQQQFFAQGGADCLIANRFWTYWKSL